MVFDTSQPLLLWVCSLKTLLWAQAGSFVGNAESWPHPGPNLYFHKIPRWFIHIFGERSTDHGFPTVFKDPVLKFTKAFSHRTRGAFSFPTLSVISLTFMTWLISLKSHTAFQQFQEFFTNTTGVGVWICLLSSRATFRLLQTIDKILMLYIFRVVLRLGSFHTWTVVRMACFSPQTWHMPPWSNNLLQLGSLNLSSFLFFQFFFYR